MQEAIVDVLDRAHPANDGLPLNWTRSDRWLNWDAEPDRHGAHGRAGRRSGTTTPGDERERCRSTRSRGAVTTTAAGPSTPAWAAPTASYARGPSSATTCWARCSWTTGMVRGDCQATIAANYKIERLTAKNAAGPARPDRRAARAHGRARTAASSTSARPPAPAAVPRRTTGTNPNIGLGCGTIHQWDPVAQAGQAADHPRR